MRRAPAYEGAVAPDPVISHLSATVDRAARWRRVVFRTSLAGACVLIAMLAMMILADTAYGGWIEDLTGLSISGIVNNFFTAIGKAQMGLWMTLVRQGVLLIPMLLLLPPLLGLDGVLWAGPISDGGAAVVVLLLGFREVRRLKALQKAQEKETPQ